MVSKKREIEIRHLVRGRIRYKIYRLRTESELSVQAAALLSGLPGILWSGTSPKSASLLVRYDPGSIDPPAITSALEGLFPRPIPSGDDSSPVPADCCRAKESRFGKIPRGAMGFLGLTGFVLYYFVRKTLFGKVVSQNFLSPVGLAASAWALPILYKGLNRFRRGGFSLDVFIGGGAMVAVMAGEAFTALEILWISSGASLLESWIEDRSRRAISEILDITSQNSYVLVDGIEVETPVDEVKAGDIVVLHTGEKVSVDGPVIRGRALVDESPINGRAVPALREAEDRVFAGTLIREGLIYVQAESVGDQTYLARIMTLVQDALDNKASLELAADRLARKLVVWSTVVPLAVLILTRSFWRAFTVLLVLACPCATALAASTAVSAAINRAARQRILIKGGRYLEEFSRMDTICFDKTGTLTTNVPRLAEIIGLSDLTEDQLLAMAYSTEKHQKHPLALAIIAEAENRGLSPEKHVVCEYHLGEGVRAELSGRNLFIGNRKLMDRYHIPMDRAALPIGRLKEEGLTILYLAEDKTLLGLFGLSNQTRPEIVSILKYLTRDGIRSTAMVSGDEIESTRPLAAGLGIQRCYASVMPEEKAAIIRKFKAEKRRVMMVGDGINDALALAEADVGVAMGAGGAEAAIEAADVALVEDDLTGLVFVHALSRATERIIKQNFWIAHGSNLAGVALGALGLMGPVSAGLLHILHTLGVLANSSRLLAYQSPWTDPGKHMNHRTDDIAQPDQPDRLPQSDNHTENENVV